MEINYCDSKVNAIKFYKINKLSDSFTFLQCDVIKQGKNYTLYYTHLLQVKKQNKNKGETGCGWALWYKSPDPSPPADNLTRWSDQNPEESNIHTGFILFATKKKQTLNDIEHTINTQNPHYNSPDLLSIELKLCTYFKMLKPWVVLPSMSICKYLIKTVCCWITLDCSAAIWEHCICFTTIHTSSAECGQVEPPQRSDCHE